VTTALNESLDDITQFLHSSPNTIQNYVNIWQPAQGGASAILAVNNFANPIQFLCGAVQAASRLGAEQSAKLCVQYLAPIMKNRQYNYPPLGLNQLIGATARPNEITYSEDWLRPDYIPPPGPPPPGPPVPLGSEPDPAAVPPNTPPLAAEMAAPTNPNDGLLGMMVPPPGSGS
jgi:phospholipid/cholesterol/gamma-HCH transport system substrate-binding protein